ncbi:unnamed protein product, partial [Scytosiphon promiscuus]
MVASDASFLERKFPSLFALPFLFLFLRVRRRGPFPFNCYFTGADGRWSFAITIESRAEHAKGREEIISKVVSGRRRGRSSRRGKTQVELLIHTADTWRELFG